MAGIHIASKGVTPYFDGEKQLLFVETFDEPFISGMWNDGAGNVSRDTDVMLFGEPTARLDPQGNDAGAQVLPGDTPVTGGVIFKRRIAHVPTQGRFGLSAFVRFTSGNLSSTQHFTTLRLYNRDGDNVRQGSVWLDHGGAAANDLSVKTHSAAGAWVERLTVDQDHVGQHIYEPTSSSATQKDRAGIWHHVQIEVDFNTGKYIAVRVDGVEVQLPDLDLFTASSSGARALHFSLEFFQTNTTARFINVAHVVGYTL